ncbi:hypothetical protein SAMN05216175_10626 [Neptunomonas qingdaonensis]|uniref:Uncharacterized protein n=1 Tax=Neptunomonas qingdaonensis TaxID=1045558 RepID=A0A1I2RA02_9GAMM|nr:hypothetical protein SAMN05216175_10626 [Neptunomonas qingdaonensis]
MVSDNFVNDVKVFFDSIRNIGICAALTLGLPFIEKTMPLIFCNSNALKFTAVSFSIGVILGLYVFNLIWLFKSLKSKGSSKFSYAISSIVIMSLITLAIGSTAFIEVWGNLY